MHVKRLMSLRLLRMGQDFANESDRFKSSPPVRVSGRHLDTQMRQVAKTQVH